MFLASFIVAAGCLATLFLGYLAGRAAVRKAVNVNLESLSVKLAEADVRNLQVVARLAECQDELRTTAERLAELETVAVASAIGEQLATSEASVPLPAGWTHADADDVTDPEDAAIVSAYLDETGLPMCWPVSRDVAAKTVGVAHRIVDSWCDHFPEAILSDGRLDLIAVLSKRMAINSPEAFDVSAIGTKH